MRRRRFAIGDPQAPFEQFRRILENHKLLSDQGRLADDVALISVGDHFDFSGGTPREVGDEGMKVLTWLAQHPPDQVVILAGNHDLSRVTELALQTDASFGEARELARPVEDLRKKKGRTADEDAELERRKRAFHDRFPDLATAELVDRDYVTFTEEQRRLVQTLLVAGRLRFAHVESLGGRPLLLTHAGVTKRELELLFLEQETDAERIARALNEALDAAVGKVRARWEKGELTPLELEPLHVPGRGGREGGGLLYHRPVFPFRADEKALAPRTYDPLDLPKMAQACGHTGHKKSSKDLAGAITPQARGFLRGGLRTLAVNGDRIVYDAGIVTGGERVLHMVDAEMNYVSHDAYPLLELTSP
jgi:hypothetical protein